MFGFSVLRVSYAGMFRVDRPLLSFDYLGDLAFFGLGFGG